MWTVIVCASAETVARVTLPPSCGQRFCAPARRSRRPQPDLRAVHPHIDPLDQQLHDPRLLGREELVPQRIELGERSPRSSVTSSCSARAARHVHRCRATSATPHA
jgi:hypothetical protein